jgi:hypothetical protein
MRVVVEMKDGVQSDYKDVELFAAGWVDKGRKCV